jgi:hypothetical protein
VKKALPILVFASLVVASGVLHGIRTDRWKPTPGMDDAVRRIDDIPMEFGDWRGEKLSLGNVDFARAGIKGHLYRRYKNTRSGQTFEVLLVCGRPGPISVHTPDVCYEGAGFTAIGSQELRDITVSPSETRKFMGLRFHRPESRSASQLEILWAWNGGEGWAASENPRMTFSHHPVLYKLYVIRNVSPRERAGNPDPFPDFLQSFLPVLDRSVYPKLTLDPAGATEP